jgi:phosphatidylinositol dimannoside acyltransferase
VVPVREALLAGPTAAAPRWYAHRLNRAAVYRIGAVLAGVLPRALRLRAAQAVATAAAGRFPDERAVVRAALARIVDGTTPTELDALVAEVFHNFAVCFTDLITSNRAGRTEDLLATTEGMEHLATAERLGRGLVVVTAHLGNWELGGRLLAGTVTRPTHVVVAPEQDPGVEQFLRGDGGPVRFVTRCGPLDVLPLVSALRRNEVVALQGDRALGGRGDRRHTFFGVPAPFPLGPFILARAARAPVLPAFCLLRPDRRYTIAIGEPWTVPAGGESEALARWVSVLEGMVRQHPTQWFNFYDVWRTC